MRHIALLVSTLVVASLSLVNVSKWSEISTHGLLFQWSTTIKIQPKSVLIYITSSSSHPMQLGIAMS